MINWNAILQILFNVLVYPGGLFVIVIGLLLAGIDRKMVARMQKRVGPPILQPTYDFFKLMGKETIVPQAANRFAYLSAPVIGLVGLLILAAFIPVFGYGGFSGSADLIVILYLLTVPAVALIVGGSASGSPYAGVGISREMVTMMAYEFPLIMILLAVARKVGGMSLCFSISDIQAWQQAHGCGLFTWSLIPAAAAMLLIIPVEVGTQPFDVAEAETEICEGPLVEYSGAPLGLFKLNSAIKMFIMTSLFTALFLGGIDTGIPVLNAVILVAIDIVLTIVCMSTIHAISARLKIEHLFKFYWTTVAAMAGVSLVLVWHGL